jgi:Cytochrome P450
LVNKHTTNSNEPLYQRLASIHVSAWEGEMPVLELIIRETLRVSKAGLSMRRNLSEDLTFSGGVVKPGDFVAYPVSDVHFNPEIYSRPYEFDPTRFTPGREEDKKATFSYLSWGAGAFLFLKIINKLFRDELMNPSSLHRRTSYLHRNKSCEIGDQGHSRFHACWFRIRRC